MSPFMVIDFPLDSRKISPRQCIGLNVGDVACVWWVENRQKINLFRPSEMGRPEPFVVALWLAISAGRN